MPTLNSKKQKISHNFLLLKAHPLLQQEVGAFGNNKGKELQKPRPKYVYYIFTANICSADNPMQVVVFCKNVLIL